MFRIFSQVWIGEIGKKDYQNFQNSLIKSLIYKIKKIKISIIF